MSRDHRGELLVEPSRRAASGALASVYLAVGDMAQPVALGRDHPPAGRAEAGIEADDDQPSFSSTASDIS